MDVIEMEIYKQFSNIPAISRWVRFMVEGKVQNDFRTLARFAHNPEGAAIGINQCLGDGQAQSGALLVSRIGLNFHKGAHSYFNISLCHARSGVPDFKIGHVGVLNAGQQCHAAACPGKLDGVGEKV